MKREEKNLQSRQKIMDAAWKEFGEKSYAEASLNTICKEGNISKGIIYHYFKDKDELFLACVRECFEALTEHLRKYTRMEEGQVGIVLKRYFDARMIFFDQNPAYLKLFCNAAILPPPHLKPAIAEIREAFDQLNISVFTRLLEQVSLRDDITVEEAVNEFRLYQDFVNAQYQMQTIHQVNIEEHEKRCSRTLEILLYGIVAREKAQT